MLAASVVALQCRRCPRFLVFFFNDTATTEIYTLSLHDALPISVVVIGLPVAARSLSEPRPQPSAPSASAVKGMLPVIRDRKSTRLNSSHQIISYAVFCLKKKKYDRSCRCRA